MPTIQETEKAHQEIREKLGLPFTKNEDFDPEKTVVEIHDNGNFRLYMNPEVDGFSVRNDGFQDFFELFYTDMNGGSELVAEFRLAPNTKISDWQLGKEQTKRLACQLLKGWLNELTMTKCYL